MVPGLGKSSMGDSGDCTRGLHCTILALLSVAQCEWQYLPWVLRTGWMQPSTPPLGTLAGAQYSGASWRLLPSEKIKQGFPRPHHPLGSPTLIFNLYFIKMKLIELWGHPLHHPGLWVPLRNEVPISLGHGHRSCHGQSQGLWLPRAIPSLSL